MIKTERLILKTNCKVIDGKFEYPKPKPVFSLLSLEPAKAENSGFAIYLKSGEFVGHISVLFKRREYELSVGIEEKYQRNGYMTEAQNAIIAWIFEYCNTNEIWALLGGITDDASRKILERTGFKKEPEGNSEWWVVRRAYLQDHPKGQHDQNHSS